MGATVFPSLERSKVAEIRFPSVSLCLGCSESSEEESTGERDEEIHAHNEAARFSETSGVSVEHGPTAQTGECWETATPGHVTLLALPKQPD